MWTSGLVGEGPDPPEDRVEAVMEAIANFKPMDGKAPYRPQLEERAREVLAAADRAGGQGDERLRLQPSPELLEHWRAEAEDTGQAGHETAEEAS